MLSSTLHGEIKRKKRNNGLLYEDTSATGTRFNKKLICDETVALKAGDVLRIGAFEIEVLSYSE